MSIFIVLDVFCIECFGDGDSDTQLVGVYETEDQAKAKAVTIEHGTNRDIVVMEIPNTFGDCEDFRHTGYE